MKYVLYAQVAEESLLAERCRRVPRPLNLTISWVFSDANVRHLQPLLSSAERAHTPGDRLFDSLGTGGKPPCHMSFPARYWALALDLSHSKSSVWLCFIEHSNQHTPSAFLLKYGQSTDYDNPVLFSHAHEETHLGRKSPGIP